MSSEAVLRRRFGGAGSYERIFDAFAAADPLRPFVAAQLGQSLDGRIATPTGASRWINGPRALDHLHRLRANVDAVVVGVTTVLADDPMLTVRRVAGRQPARVVIDPNNRMSATARCLADDGVRCVVVRAQDDGGDRYDGRRGPAESVTVERRGGMLDPVAIADALHALGLRKLLIEGGASTISAFLNAGAVDRLHVLVAPMILGSGTMGLTLAPIAGLDEARRPDCHVHVLDDGDVLFDCDLRQQQTG